jgi:hypothetical protein
MDSRLRGNAVIVAEVERQTPPPSRLRDSHKPIAPAALNRKAAKRSVPTVSVFLCLSLVLFHKWIPAFAGMP